MSKTYDVCIRGAGIVGRTLALHLAAQRLRVALVTSGDDVHGGHSDVRAYALSPFSRAILENVRCWPAAPHATPVLRMQVHGDADVGVQFRASELGVEALNWIIDVPVLESLLADAVRFQSLIETVTVPVAAALTVVCEGRASQTRSEFGVDFDVTPYAQTACAARIHCSLGHAQAAQQWFTDGDVLALLPLGGENGHECALVWSASTQRAQALQELAAEAFCRALETACHGALGTMTLNSVRKSWPLQAANAQQWCGSHASGTWVLAGDAAHNVHPLAGQGLNLGLADVAELALQLGKRTAWRSVGDLRLLRAYERARKADYAVIGGAGDALQRIFQHDHPTIQALRNLGMRGFERSRILKQWVAARAMGKVGTYAAISH